MSALRWARYERRAARGGSAAYAAAQRPAPLVTLLTDFGLTDPFVGVMKGALLRRLPHARVVDLCHGIAPQSVREGAYWLDRCPPWFPPGTVHVAVVDPGVGSARQVLAARLFGQIFVAPDNGLLSERLLAAPDAEVRAVDVERLGLRPASATFHGRDVFAPLAALLARGARRLTELGPACVPVASALPRPRAAGATLEGEIVTVDRFGNLISNVDRTALGERAPRGVRLAGRDLPVVRTYADAAPGALVALVNAFECIEVAERDGNAAERLALGPGAQLTVALGHAPARS